MSRLILMRLALPAWLTLSFLPGAVAQSQDTPSVAEAARKAKAQKKTSKKPARVITEDDVKIDPPGTPENPVTDAKAPGEAQNSKDASKDKGKDKDGEKKEPQEVTDLKDRIKQAENDLDFQKRQLSLDQDAVYSKTDYANDRAGLAKIASEKQQVSDKQQEVDGLKAKLADLLKSLN